MNLLIGGKIVLTQPANAGDYIIAKGGVGRCDTLTLGRQQAQGVARSLRIGAVPRATGNGQDLIESLDDFIPLEVIATDEEVAARGTTYQLGMVDATLLDI